jgi:leucyl aminopeptidase
VSLTFALQDLADPKVAQWIAFGMMLRCWQFDKYRTRLKPDQTIALKEATFVVKSPDAAAKAFAEEQALAESIQFARTLIAEPPNVLYPKSLMDQIRSLADIGLEIEALDQGVMKKLGMGALLGVAQGSESEPYLGIMRWNGGKEGEAPLAFVGKGVTFDTGGISIKPAQNMDEMKADMAGAAVVIGLMRTLAARKAPVNAVGVVALVENMPSGSAQRPGDIVTSMSGQTIEVLNTDAEGRLILADALYYTHDRFKPRYMVDLATLTLAIRIALGSEYAGLFTTDNELAASLEKAGHEVGERLWRMPLEKAYDKELDSYVADIKNIAASGYGAGSAMGGQFLARFVGDTTWAHLDIANMDFGATCSPRAPKGPTGFGVCLLNRWVKTLVG